MTRFAIFSDFLFLKHDTFLPIVTTGDDNYIYYCQSLYTAELDTLDYNTFVNYIYSYIKQGNQSPYLPYLRNSISTIFKTKLNQQ